MLGWWDPLVLSQILQDLITAIRAINIIREAGNVPRGGKEGGRDSGEGAVEIFRHDVRESRGRDWSLEASSESIKSLRKKGRLEISFGGNQQQPRRTSRCSSVTPGKVSEERPGLDSSQSCCAQNQVRLG